MAEKYEMPFALPGAERFGMEKMMILELKENIPHGTKEYPYDQYYIHNIKRQFQFPAHWHDEFEIIYIKQGNLQIYIEEREYSGKEGSVFLVNPRELHFMGSADLSVAYYTLLFPLEFISFQSDDELEKTLLQPLRNGQLLMVNQITEEGLLHSLGRLFDELIALNEQQTPQYRLKTHIMLLCFLDSMMEHGLLMRPRSNASRIGRQKELLLYIREHYTEQISLQTLAGQFHLSEKYISRYFKEHFYLTFSDYLNHLRLSSAKRLLETTELSVTETALHSGFLNVSYFIRTFKAAYGTSPLKYRKSIS